MELNEGLTKLVDSDCYKQLKDFYEKKSSLDIFGISRKEYAHSNFLYWLLNDKSNHTLGTLPLKRLLGIFTDTISQEYFKGNLNISELGKITYHDYSITDLEIYREYDIKEYGRLDLFLTFNLSISINEKSVDKKVVMIIENKIYSDENDDQTEKYYEWLNTNFDTNTIIPICIYLTPFKAEPKCTEFKNIIYSRLVRNVIEPSLYQSNNEYAKNIIRDYLRCFTFNENDSKDSILITLKELILVNYLYEEFGETINNMINTDDIRQNEIYNDNKSVLNNILRILAQKNVSDEIGVPDYSMKKKIDEILGNAKEYKFGQETYKSGSRQNPLKKLALAIIKDYAQKNQLSIEELSNDLNGVCTTAKGLQLFVKTEEITSNEDLKDWYFEKENELINFDGNNYSLYAWWNNEEIQKLIDRTKGKLTNEIQ